jgi:polysaccharide export outer membrane protein
MLIIRVPLRSGSFRSVILLPAALVMLSACASLPVSGPTGHEVRTAALGKSGQYPFTLVDVDTATAIPSAPMVPVPALATMPPRPTDLLGPGDVLNISIYEAGVSLFGTALRTAAAANGAIDTSSTA